MNNKYNNDYCKALGEHLRKTRQNKGISMRKLAMAADMEYSQYWKIEHGIINTTVSSIQAIAEALNIPVKELYDFPFPLKNIPAQ